MRTINKIFSLLAIASLAGFVSCQPEENFQPGEPENAACEGVYFPKQKKIEEVQIFDPTQAKRDTIKVSRTNEDNALTIVPKVSLSYLDAKGNTVEADAEKLAAFTVGDIVFEDGQVEAKIPIDFSGIEEGVQYSLHIAIEGDQYASIYSSSTKACDYKVMCVKYVDFTSPADPDKPAKVTFTQGFWGEKHTAYIKYYEVGGVRHCITYDEETAATKEEQPKWSFDGGFFGMGKDYHLEFDWYVEDQDCDCGEGPHSPIVPAGKPIPENAELIWMKPAYVFTTGGYDLYEWDYYSFYVAYRGYARSFVHFIVMNDAYDSVSYYDGNGGFYFYSYPGIYNTAFNYGAGLDGIDIVGIADGYVRSDYKLELTAGMTQADSEAKNVVPVEFKLGTDVAKVGYTVTKGSLSGALVNAEAAAIAKDTIDYKYATYVDAAGVSFSDSISVAETGVYTLVAVGFDDKKNAQTTASVTFNYLATGETSEVLLNVEANSTKKYASRGYSPITSIEQVISGNGITGAVPMLFTEAEVEEEGGIKALVDDFLASPNLFYSILTDEDYQEALELYPLSATQLADVNDKGYSEILTDLRALTTYYVIVWATNGYDTAVKYAKITTDGLPNVKVKDKTATFTYTALFGGYDESTGTEYPIDQDGMSLEFNPNSNMYEIPNWGYYGVTFTFSVDENKKLAVPVQSVGGGGGVADYKHTDDLFGAGAAAYFTSAYGLDLSSEGYIDEDGCYHFFLIYSYDGYLYLGEEFFYPDGKPAAAPDPVIIKNAPKAPKLSLSNRKRVSVLSEMKSFEAPVVRVAAGHKIGTVSRKYEISRKETPVKFNF